MHAKENGLKKVGLGVSSYQAPAIGLYLRKGFEAVKKTRVSLDGGVMVVGFMWMELHLARD